MTHDEPDAIPPRPRRTWLTVLLCALIFAGGGVVGAGITAMHVGRQTKEALAHPDQLPQRVANRLRGRLDLDAEQARHVEQVVLRRYQHILQRRASLLQDVGPEVDAIRREILPVLRRDQARRLEQLIKNFREGWLPGAGKP